MTYSPDDTQDPGEQYPGDSSGHLNPVLTDFVGQRSTDMGHAWAGIAANRVQEYLTARSNAIDAQQAGDEFVNNLHQARSGLVGMVKNDPGSTDLALDLAQHAVNGIVDQHGHLDEDQRSGAASDLIDHFQNQIAHTAVQSLAETDKGMALQALDRYGKYLPDGEQAALRQYADVQEGLRGQDAVAQSAQNTRDAALAGYHAATQYLSSLIDPATGQFRAPQGFLQSLVADPAIATTTKLALRAGFGMLNQNGDPAQSNPHVVNDFIQRMAADVQPLRPGSVAPFGVPGVTGDTLRQMQDQGIAPGYSMPNPPVRFNMPDSFNPANEANAAPKQGEILSHLGSGLTIADAAFLNHLSGPSDPQRRADIRQLADTLSQARDALAHPVNGDAGTQAFGRFTNWLVPALARGANLNEIMAANPIPRFAPTVNDYRPMARPFGVA